MIKALSKKLPLIRIMEILLGLSFIAIVASLVFFVRYNLINIEYSYNDSVIGVQSFYVMVILSIIASIYIPFIVIYLITLFKKDSVAREKVVITFAKVMEVGLLICVTFFFIWRFSAYNRYVYVKTYLEDWLNTPTTATLIDGVLVNNYENAFYWGGYIITIMYLVLATTPILLVLLIALILTDILIAISKKTEEKFL